MNVEDTNISTYENVKKIYEKINRFLNNDFVSSNIAKLNAYQSKIDKLAQNVEKATQEKAKEPVVVDEKKEEVQKIQETKNEENTENAENEQYNPYSEKFYYKDRLIKLNGNIVYNNVMINLGENVPYKDENIISIPKGNYLTMYFDDAYRDSGKYYDIIMDYIKKNNIEPKSDFHEIYIMTRVGMNGKEKSLGQIEILI